MSAPENVSAAELLRWAETLSGVARTGLGFTKSLYEKERFEEVLKVAADIRAAAIDEATIGPRSCSPSAPIRAGGCTRSDGPTSDTHPRRSP